MPIGSYVSNDPRVYSKYVNTLGCTLLEAISNYMYKHRRGGREVLFMGDLNAYTGTLAGWDGSESILASAFTPGRRRSDCTGALNERERDLNHLAQLNEMRILNELTLPWLRADAIGTRIGSNPGDEAETV